MFTWSIKCIRIGDKDQYNRHILLVIFYFEKSERAQKHTKTYMVHDANKISYQNWYGKRLSGIISIRDVSRSGRPTQNHEGRLLH